jgi:hypothetical protein
LDVRAPSALQGMAPGALADALATREALAATTAGEAVPDAWRAQPAAALAAGAVPSRLADALPTAAPTLRSADAEASADNPAPAAPAAPSDDGRVRDTVAVPTQLSALHIEAPREPVRRELPARERAQRERPAHASIDVRDESPDEGDDASGDDSESGAGEHTDVRAAAPHPGRDEPAVYEAIVAALHRAAQTEALRELTHQRRIWIVSPRSQRASESRELVLRLLGSDASGAVRVRAYRARGERAACERATALWCVWRAHRDVGADGEPRIIARPGRPARLGQGIGGALALRLSAGRLPAPLPDANTSWLDMLDVQRLLADLGRQWCVTLVWAPQALVVDGAVDAPARAR